MPHAGLLLQESKVWAHGPRVGSCLIKLSKTDVSGGVREQMVNTCPSSHVTVPVLAINRIVLCVLEPSAPLQSQAEQQDRESNTSG